MDAGRGQLNNLGNWTQRNSPVTGKRNCLPFTRGDRLPDYESIKEISSPLICTVDWAPISHPANESSIVQTQKVSNSLWPLEWVDSLEAKPPWNLIEAPLTTSNSAELTPPLQQQCKSGTRPQRDPNPPLSSWQPVVQISQPSSVASAKMVTVERGDSQGTWDSQTFGQRPKESLPLRSGDQTGRSW